MSRTPASTSKGDIDGGGEGRFSEELGQGMGGRSRNASDSGSSTVMRQQYASRIISVCTHEFHEFYLLLAPADPYQSRLTLIASLPQMLALTPSSSS